MKPRDSVLQGGGAATTDPRKPNYDNLFPMLDVDWDDPSVGELSRRQNKHPVEVILDLALENDNRMFVQPIVNESPADVLNLLEASAHLGDLLRIRARMSARRWARRCKPIC